MNKEKIISEKIIKGRIFRLIEVKNYQGSVIMWKIVEVFKYHESEYEDYGTKKEIWPEDGDNIESADCRFYEFIQDIENDEF